MKSSILLAGASVLALASGIDSAQAAPTFVYGGGSTLAAKVYRDLLNCFSTAADGIFAQTPGNPSNVTYPTAENPSCATQGKAPDFFFYEPVGSGAGLAAWDTANPANFGQPSATNPIAYLDSTEGVSGTPYTQVQFAGSDAYLTGQDSAASAAVGGEAVFQIPTFATPITIPVGQTQNVKLTTVELCNIASGKTNKAGAVTFSEFVVRSDSSGTSFIFSDWLEKNCAANLGFNSGNGFPSTTPNWTAVSKANGAHITIVPASGSGGVASTIASTANAIGYVSPDYVYPVVASSTAYPSYINGKQPTLQNVTAQLTHTTYPGSYDVSSIGQQINDALVSPGGKGYPIVGFTFVEAYSCYSTSLAGGNIGGPAQGKALLAWLKALYIGNSNSSHILNGQGFAQAPAALHTLLESSGGPLNATSGIQNASCPKT